MASSPGGGGQAGVEGRLGGGQVHGAVQGRFLAYDVSFRSAAFDGERV
jgi:hypothetical protein